MKMSRLKTAIVSATVLAIATMYGPTLPVAWSMDAAQREALVASLPRGETFENDGDTYVWLPTLRGARTTGGNAVERSASAAAGSREVVQEKGHFTIYGPSGAAESAATASAPSGYGIALNLRTKSLAVITGNIWLKLKNMRDTAAIATEYGLVFSFSNAAMSTSFYSVPPEMDIQALRKKLLADPRVLTVTLDMLDRIRHPR